MIMKKSILIWITAALLAAIAVYTTGKFNSKPDIVVSPPQEQQAVQDSAAPTPTPAQPEDGSDADSQQEPEKTDLMKDFDFSLEDLNGSTVSLSDYKGKRVFLNFWATWCPPCKAEMPDIEKLYQETKDSDLVILAVNVGEDKKTVQAFIRDKGYNFPVLLDDEGEVSQLYQVAGIPTSYFIDTEGYLDDGISGPISLESMKEFVNNLK